MLRVACILAYCYIVLCGDPFVIRPSLPGVNRVKLSPPQIAAVGVSELAPKHLRGNPKLIRTAEDFGRALMVPSEVKKRLAPPKKKKSEKRKNANQDTKNLFDGMYWQDARESLQKSRQNRGVKEVSTNLIVLAGALVTVLSCPVLILFPGWESIPIIGLGALFTGAGQTGCQGTPEIAMAGACVIVLSYLTSDNEPKKSKYQRSLEKKQRKTAKPKKEKKEKKAASDAPIPGVDTDLMRDIGKASGGGCCDSC